MSILDVSKRFSNARVKLPIICSRVCSLPCQSDDLEFSSPDGDQKYHIHHFVGEVHPNTRTCDLHDAPPVVWRDKCHRGWFKQEWPWGDKAHNDATDRLEVIWEVNLCIIDLCILVVLVYVIEWIRRWAKSVIFTSHPNRQMHEVCIGPFVLRLSIQKLDDCVQHVTKVVGQYDVETQADSIFLKTFLYEWFLILAPRLVEFPEVVIKVVKADNSKIKNTTGTHKCMKVAKFQATISLL